MLVLSLIGKMMKIRVVSGEIAFYTNPTAIKRGVGDHVKFNEAVRRCYESLLEFNRSVKKSGGITAVGQSGNWCGMNVQIDLIKD